MTTDLEKLTEYPGTGTVGPGALFHARRLADGKDYRVPTERLPGGEDFSAVTLEEADFVDMAATARLGTYVNRDAYIERLGLGTVLTHITGNASFEPDGTLFDPNDPDLPGTPVTVSIVGGAVVTAPRGTGGTANAIPLAGTASGSPVTGPVTLGPGGSLVFADQGTPGVTITLDSSDGFQFTVRDGAGAVLGNYTLGFDAFSLPAGAALQLTADQSSAPVSLTVTPTGQLLVNGQPVLQGDPYDVSLAIRQEVANRFAAQDTTAGGPGQGLPWLDDGQPQPADSLVGMAFIDPQLGYHYTYCPVAFANGSPNIWICTKLGR